MVNAQNYDSYITIPSSQTYGYWATFIIYESSLYIHTLFLWHFNNVFLSSPRCSDRFLEKLPIDFTFCFLNSLFKLRVLIIRLFLDFHILLLLVKRVDYEELQCVIFWVSKLLPPTIILHTRQMTDDYQNRYSTRLVTKLTPCLCCNLY
jgi:hypothetical protein